MASSQPSSEDKLVTCQSTERSDLPSYFSKAFKSVWFSLLVLDKSLTVEEVFKKTPHLHFARIPVFDEELDNIVGIVRRRDLLTQIADDNDDVRLVDIMDDVRFVPETVTAYSALQSMLKSHQQLLAVVDEFGSLAGVVAMEDIMESILGREIFEKDDVAIDMRELARNENSEANDPLTHKES